MQSLKGNLLIATAKMPDPRFHEQVIYICAHDHEGAMGLVINRPIVEINMADILLSANLPCPKALQPQVYMGGPVEPTTGFFLHTADYTPKEFLRVSDTVIMSRDSAILNDIAIGQGPAHYIFALGYAGWAPDQLEHELSDNGWLTVPGKDEILFATPDENKWKAAAQIYGIDIALYGDITGTA
ncbi:MAG: YqgE/AlgH family protein [Desulfobulbaceae bacterium]|nr:YqgE/AlgH family protein [Desulfobulbaceae bacterium]